MRVLGVATVVAVFGAPACGSKNGDAPIATPTTSSTCVPTGADLAPSHMSLTGATATFCLASRVTRYCFTADLEKKTIAAAPEPPASDKNRTRTLIFEDAPTKATIEPSANGKAITVCTADKRTCHDLPIAGASIDEKPMAVSDDAMLVAIDTRSYRQNDVRKSPGRIETWDAVTAKKLASFDMKYGPDHLGTDDVRRTGILAFLGHTLIAFTEPGCALPCSSATIYSTEGKYIGMLAADPTATSAERVRDELFVLYAYGPDRSFILQDLASGTSVRPDTEMSWDAVATPDRILRVVGLSRTDDKALPLPRLEVWGPDLKIVTKIFVPTCAPVSAAK